MIKEKKEKRAKILKDQRDMISLVEKEERQMNAEESAKYEDLDKEFDTLSDELHIEVNQMVLLGDSNVVIDTIVYAPEYLELTWDIYIDENFPIFGSYVYFSIDTDNEPLEDIEFYIYNEDTPNLQLVLIGNAITADNWWIEYDSLILTSGGSINIQGSLEIGLLVNGVYYKIWPLIG